MKTVFKGTIDGVDYYDMPAYNKALKEKIKEGKGYSANYSYSSTAEDSSEESPESPKSNVENKKCIKYSLPGFSSKESFIEFLDSISTDYRSNEINKSMFHRSMDREFENIIEEVDNCTDENYMTGYFDEIEKVRKNLDEIENDNKKALCSAVLESNKLHAEFENLSARLKELDDLISEKNKSINILTGVSDEIVYMGSCYKGISDYVSSALDNISHMASKESENTDTNTTVVETDKKLGDIITESEQKVLEESYPGIYRLLNRIFS